VKSLCGEVRVKRAYYHCPACHHGHTPWDGAQGLTAKIETPRLKAAVCKVMGRLVYSEGVRLLQELCRVSLEESTAQAIVAEVGQRVRAQQNQCVEQVQALTKRASAEHLMLDTSQEEAPPPLEVRAVQGERLYVGVDATTAHIDGGWHNVQNALVFTVKTDAQGRDRMRQRAYVAGQMDMPALGWQIRTLAAQWNAGAYSEVVFVADGAPCNWNLACTHFPKALLILDFFHASEHLWELSRALYKQQDAQDKALGERWVEARLESLKAEGAAGLLRALKRRKGRTPAQREALRQANHYFKTNAGRMNYHEHLAAGRMIGSGPVEAACKSVVGVRLKQAGMRWTREGADAVLAVRTTLLNGDSARLAQLARAA
jgi:hypothetical protein